jgi:hypothetical protein
VFCRPHRDIRQDSRTHTTKNTLPAAQNFPLHLFLLCGGEKSHIDEMDDDFYSPVWNGTISSPGLLSSVWRSVVSSPSSVLVTLLLLAPLIIIGTRLLSGQASVQIQGTKEKSVFRPPYWIPVVGHAYQM